MVLQHGLTDVAFSNGFDSNTFGGLSALPSFKAYFDLAKGNTQGLLAMVRAITAHFA